jgi:TM2 domain-containing membrane protein YozV
MRPKSTLVAFILWLPGLIGVGGLHRFYLGFTGTGIVWFCTAGLLWVGQLIDLFRLGSLVRTANLYRHGGFAGNVAVANANTVSPTINITVAAPAAPAPAEATMAGAPASRPAAGAVSIGG